MPSAIHAIADRLRPTLKRQFIAAVKALQGRVPLEDLARSVETGTAGVRLEAALRGVPDDLRGAVATVNRVFEESARETEAALAQRFRLGTSFEIVNPLAVAAAQGGGALITQVTAETRAAIGQIIASAIETGIPPVKAARLIRPMIGLTSRQSLAVLNYYQSLVGSGQTGDRAATAAQRYSNRLLRFRAETIARTETIDAGRAGRNAAWEGAQRQGYLPPTQMKRWVVTFDDRLCPACTWMSGQEVRLNELYKTPMGGMSKGPTLHPRCRCTERLVIVRARPRGAPASPARSAVSDLPSDDVLQTRLDAVYAKAPAAKAEIDDLASRVAAKTGGTVAVAPLKGQARALEKLKLDYGGDVARLKDIARNTVVVEQAKFEQAVAMLAENGVNIRVITPRSNIFGYSGANGSLATQSGLFAEIQVNTPEMIYAKESRATAEALLGADRYAALEKRLGIPGGRGHDLYEQARVLSFGDKRLGPIAAESRRYYNAARRK